MGLAFESWTLDIGGGVALPVWEVDAKAKSEVRNQKSAASVPSAGLTCVLIHGWGHSRIDMLLRVLLPFPAARTAVAVALLQEET